MALSKVTRKFSELFKTKDTRVAETPQLYLKLTTKCMKQVDTMVSTSPKFNHEQCQYLVDKLKMAVGSAQSFLGLINTWYCTFASDEDMAESVEIFKMLLSLGKAVESFIQGCCQDAWIQSALELTNVSEHVSSLGFSLELCTIVFSTREEFPTVHALTVIEIASLNAEEAKIVREKANLDHMRLIKDVNALIQSSKSGSEEWQLAKFLFGRLKSPSEHPSPALEVNESNLPVDFFENLEELNLLGAGSFGKVHKARWLGAEVAKKTMNGQGILQEVSILDRLHHPNIVSFFAYNMRTGFGKCYMIMELMDGDLCSLIEKRVEKVGVSSSPFTISGALDIMLQMAEGMLFLHEKRIVHRDLKSGNILVKFVKASDANVIYVHAKVADFGLSKTKDNSVTYSDQTPNQGTARWMAPEMVRFGNDGAGTKMFQGVDEARYPFKCDTYSFAMVCCEILTGKVPFSDFKSEREVKHKVLSGDRPQLPAECPDGLRTLIEACWNAEPSARPDFRDICLELRHLKYSQLMRSAWANVPRCFSLHDIMRMTNNFSRENVLSSWSSPAKSTAYRGLMVHTGEVVAVQRLSDAGNPSSDLDHSKMEMEVFPRLHHHSSVTFIGFCSEKGERILVFGNIMATHWMLHEYNSIDYSTDTIVWEANSEAYLTHYLQLNMRDLLAFPLQVGKLVRKSALEAAHSYRQECLDVNNRVTELIQLLGELSRASKLTANAVRLYERPTRRIMKEVVAALVNASYQLARKSRRSSMQLRRVVTTHTEFGKVDRSLESSIGDVKWLLNISFTNDKHSEFAGLPPIASTDPVLAHVWEQVSIVHVGTAEEKAGGAEYLGNLAKGNERNVKIIIEEGGAAPLLRLLKEGTVAGQEAAATALGHLARDRKRVRQLRNVGASTVFTHILNSRSTSMAVQLQVAHVIAKFASLDKEAQGEFASQGAIKLLVALLEHQANTLEAMEGVSVASVVVRTSSTSVRGSSPSHALHPHPAHESGSDAEVQPVVMDLEEDPEVKLGLMGEAAHALWKLAAGNIENCKLITDTCALLCFAKLMKYSVGELKYNSVMAVMEIAAAAECDPEFRDATFATNSPSAKAVVEQLLEEITNANGEPELQVSCCRAIGSLAQIFPPPAESPIRALTSALANFEANQDEDQLPVVTEAASALRKFASNCFNLEHYED